ncbi:putative aminomethyltransferase, mitochondrial [Neospora caninum Liverpool]|uniref:Putative aminomethyltransferase, mitochondrial n=1 Tax=Neospora caninum (strain Liverpool) TaxID=572307 RepID=F0VKU3_NEOCL|nr:putative aminomethyltransferase, mitochondrial [Neospora caninum Liverpool]CBZ54694.1 putative aminomethyltransferase, mitochondrial [Neospora caninum Liverpool]|eukprot:XP_003884724.1 putative aminomethyltransferase, mitochondrial [Neospora caninum Liverpool]
MPASGRVPSMSEPVVHTPQTVRPAVVVAERTLAPDAVSQPTFPSPAAASSPPSVQAKESASPSAPSGSRAPPATSVRLSPLHEVHAGLGAKFGKFQGVLLPFAYEGEGVMSSHLHTRTCASLFDFSYRQHYRIWGEKAAQLLERLVVGDVQSLLETESRFTLFTNDDGGILDDVIVAVHPGFLLVMGNACNKAKVLERLEAEAAIARGREKSVQPRVRVSAAFAQGFVKRNLALDGISSAVASGERVTVEALDDFTLLGVQGAQAMEVMGQVVDAASVDLVKMPFMSSYLCTVEGVECVLTRCGFSGEDGFEISLLSEEASMVFSALLEKSSLLRPAGFGTRETLRQEAGLCLYGADIDEETTPVEASLGWAVGRRRRQEANFPGASRILAQLVQLQLLQSQAKSRVHIDAETLQAQLDEAAEKAGIFEVDRLRRKRVGLALPAGGSTTKGGVAVLSLEGEKKVGAVTSSCFAPSLQRTIGMAYLDLPYTLPKTRVQLDTPRPTKDVEVCKMPFVPGAYYRVPLPL